MKEKIRGIMDTLSYILEILVGFLIICSLFVSLLGLIYSIKLEELFSMPSIFSSYLAVASTIVIGVEFVKMLYTHTLDSVIEVMLLAIARQMITEHSSPEQNFISVLSVAILYIVRKFLYIKQLDQINSVNIKGFKFLKRRKKNKEGDNGENVNTQ